MIFYKTSSFGNDFIEVDAGGLARGTSRAALVRSLCDRQRGVGADGVVLYKLRANDWHFEIFNRDGGAAELSGNGMAGLAAVLLQRRLASPPLVLRTAVGRRRVALVERRGVIFRLDVEIGVPDFAARGFFPFLKAGHDSYRCAGVEFHPVSVGNPHAVIICRGLPAAARAESLGKELEGHPMFPKRVNVEFVQVTSSGNCRVNFFERGVGPTQASSTGSAAVFAVLRRLGKIHDQLDIELDGASTAEGPTGKEVGHARECAEAIHVRWDNGIFIRNVTRVICRGEFFL